MVVILKMEPEQTNVLRYEMVRLQRLRALAPWQGASVAESCGSSCHLAWFHFATVLSDHMGLVLPGWGLILAWRKSNYGLPVQLLGWPATHLSHEAAKSGMGRFSAPSTVLSTNTNMIVYIVIEERIWWCSHPEPFQRCFCDSTSESAQSRTDCG